MTAHNPTEIHILFQNAFNLRDVEALISLYEPDAILMVGGKQVTGRETFSPIGPGSIQPPTSV